MGNLLKNSALTTKVRAMKSRLVTGAQYNEMASLSSVTNCVEYLKALSGYAQAFLGIDAGELHRAAIEQRLLQSQYRDFSSLYRFSDLKQRKFLDLYFIHYEILILKRCLRGIIGHTPLDLDLSLFQDFFSRHSKLNLQSLAASANLAEFTANLSGSAYYQTLSHLMEQENVSLFDYEMNLDFIYFKTMWRIKDKITGKKERAIITQSFGSKLDLLNIQWIYRCLTYYHMDSTRIFSLLIPVFYHLKAEEIQKMALAASRQEFFAVLSTTWYGRRSPAEVGQMLNPEVLAAELLDKIHLVSERNDPYSIAIVNTYLYFKETEINRIIRIIESIRYGVPQTQIIDEILTSKEALTNG